MLITGTQRGKMKSLTGLKQLITETTRFAHNGSIIDLIYTNSDCVMNAGTLNLHVSDHETIFVTRKKVKERYKVVESFGRSYTKYNKSEFQAQLRNCNWDVLNSLTDVNEYWNVIEENIKNTVDIFCPLRQMKIKDRGDPWITKELIELLHDKDRIRKKANNSGRREDWEEAKAARNFVNRTIRMAKADFIKDSLISHKNDPKKYWESIDYYPVMRHI